jgi:hypothetical protein
VGGPISASECFSTTLEPPFELLDVHYIVRGRSDELGSFDLQIRTLDEGEPGDVVFSQTIHPATVVMGDNVVTLTDPPQIETSEFCVGFDAPGSGLTSALGIAVDESSSLEDVSWLRMVGTGPCNLEWEDIMEIEPNPTGNWCIDVNVRQAE